MPDDARGAGSGAADSDRPEASGSPEPAAADTGTGSQHADGGGRTGGAAEADAAEPPGEPETAEPSEPTTPADGSGPSSEQSETAATSPAKRRATSRRRKLARLAGWTAAAVVVVLVAAAGTAYGYYRSLQGNIVRHDLSTALNEEDRPEKIGDDVNILFIGSDGREGGNAAYGGRHFVGERSDALMLAHISPDGRATVVNFPRDSLVQIPECETYGETEGTPPYHGMINAALFHGGPPCVVKTVESLTNVRIDHFAHLSFVGFREMIDSIGGVQMCIPEPMQDERAQLDLEAGSQRLDGEEALSFVRARYEIGNGSDIGRISRQQMFLGALADEVVGTELLTNPSEATGMLRAVTEHAGTDEAFDLPTMVSIGSTLSGSDLSEIAFYTVPWQQAPLDPNRVVWDEDAAARLFSAIRHDRPVDERNLVTGAEDTGGEDGGDTGTGDSGSGDAGTGDPGPSSAPADPEQSGEPAADGESTAQSGTAPIEGRDATSNPCANGLGKGTQETGEGSVPEL